MVRRMVGLILPTINYSPVGHQPLEFFESDIHEPALTQNHKNVKYFRNS